MAKIYGRYLFIFYGSRARDRIVFLTSFTRKELGCIQTEGMKNLVSIVEIPTGDFLQAVAFYQAILIDSEMGFYAMFLDTERNRLGLYFLK